MTVPAPSATDTVAATRTAAAALAELLPSPAPLTVGDADGGPAPDATVVRASYVGALSAELFVVADAAIAEALADAGGSVQLADALRPALEAAAATLGAGVLDATSSGPVGDAMAEDDVVVAALVDASGTARAWFGLRVRQADTVGARAGSGVPHPRGASDRPVAERAAAMRLLHDVEMTLTAEIGRTKLPVRQVLELVPGTVLELDRAAGSPADVMVNGRLVARGEVVVVDEEYGIRITEIVGSDAPAAG